MDLTTSVALSPTLTGLIYWTLFQLCCLLVLQMLRLCRPVQSCVRNSRAAVALDKHDQRTAHSPAGSCVWPFPSLTEGRVQTSLINVICFHFCSHAMMDLLVELCLQNHLNPSHHALEIRSSETQQPLSFKPNTLVGTLNVHTVFLKEKVPEEKV